MTAPETPTAVVELRVPARDFYQAIGAVLPQASGDDTLPVLKAVLLEVHGAALSAAATNRHVLGVVTVQLPTADADGFRFLLDRVDAERLVKQLKVEFKRYPNVEITLERAVGAHGDTMLTVRTPSGEVRVHEVYGEFPPYRKLLDYTPERDPVGEVSLDLDFLYGLRQSRAALDEKGASLRLRFRGPDRGVDVEIGQRFRGLIMPIRTY